MYNSRAATGRLRIAWWSTKKWHVHDQKARYPTECILEHTLRICRATEGATAIVGICCDLDQAFRIVPLSSMGVGRAHCPSLHSGYMRCKHSQKPTRRVIGQNVAALGRLRVAATRPIQWISPKSNARQSTADCTTVFDHSLRERAWPALQTQRSPLRTDFRMFALPRALRQPCAVLHTRSKGARLTYASVMLETELPLVIETDSQPIEHETR